MALIGVAVVIGIILLQVVDDGSSGPADAGSPQVTTATTAAPTTDDTTATTSGSQEPARSPAEVRVLVLNSGAPTGSAGNVAEALKGVGYVNQPHVPDDDTDSRDGNAVMCRTGFDQEATDLALAVPSDPVIVPFRSPDPPFSEQADCVVLVGTPVSDAAATTTTTG